MRTLVTGGSGFLGSHLCRYLLKQERDEVICLDNHFTGKRTNVQELEADSRFKLLPHDITKPIPRMSVEQVYNLACPASPVHYQSDPIETIKANTLGMINVMEFSRLNGARVLQASTSEVYGDPLEHPQKETYRGNVNTLGPRACYDVGKMAAETIISDYHRKFRVPVRIARIFNTYGPNMDTNDGRVISNFIIQALRGESITIYGTGKQTRSFCYVDDLIKGLHLLMNSNAPELNDTNAPYPVNLGNPNEFKISELAELVISLTDSFSEIIYEKLPQDDPKQRQPDITRARKVLNWSPETQLEQGLEKTIIYFRKVIKRET